MKKTTIYLTGVLRRLSSIVVYPVAGVLFVVGLFIWVLINIVVMWLLIVPFVINSLIVFLYWIFDFPNAGWKNLRTFSGKIIEKLELKVFLDYYWKPISSLYEKNKFKTD